MKREEKNLHSRHKIIDAALQEFASKGYGLSSVNTICNEGDISKGILYHYFKDKDDIYLTCIKECFGELTAYLREHVIKANNYSVQNYFNARLTFFKKNPLYQRLFCDAIISPPSHLKKEIGSIKADFDALNISVLTDLLKGYKLQHDIDLGQAIEMFQLFQDFVNARYQMMPDGEFDLVSHESMCSRSINVLLYGVIAREE